MKLIIIKFSAASCRYLPRMSEYSRQHPVLKHYLFILDLRFSRSEWPRGQTLGSWVRIPLKAWMSVYVYFVFVLSCVQVAALRRADPPPKESYRLRKRSRN
jgi:hypothetical protein